MLFRSVDTAVDLRQQALAQGIDRVDAVLFTHAHADHILGLDDLRAFNELQGRPMPCYANDEAWRAIKRTFFYVFEGTLQKGGGVPQLVAHDVDGPIDVEGLRVVPVPLRHGKLPILGYRFGNFAYLTDCNAIPAESWPLIEGTEVLILDALRIVPHETHFTIDEALEVVARLKPRRTYFTHMTHELPYAATNARLPRGVEIGRAHV